MLLLGGFNGIGDEVLGLVLGLVLVWVWFLILVFCVDFGLR